MSVPTILVTGPVGVGKSTVAEQMGYLLLADQIVHANVDFDQLTAGPRPADDDVWGTNLGLANLAAIWTNYERAGARRLIINRVISSRSALDGFRQAVPGADIVIVRLRATPETLRSRVLQRGRGISTDWQLNEAVALAARMDADPFEDLLVETDARDATTVAREVLQRTGWLSA